MAKLVLLALTLMTLAQAGTLTSNNYGGLKVFIQGFLDGYNNADFDLPDTCLPAEQQSQLDQDIVRVLSYFVRLDLAGVFRELSAVIKDFAEVSSDCGLDEISQNYAEESKKNGPLYFFSNFFWHLFDIEAKALDSLGAFAIADWYKAGNNLGKAVDFIVPSSA